MSTRDRLAAALEATALALCGLQFCARAGRSKLKDFKAQSGGECDVAVVAAAENYTSVSKLPGARKNGQPWFKYLTQSRGIASGRVTFLLDSQVPNAMLPRVSLQVASQVKPGGRLWSIFIGHGTSTNEGQGLLVSADARQGAEVLVKRSVPRQDFISILEKAIGKRVAVVLDARFSGTSGGQVCSAGVCGSCTSHHQCGLGKYCNNLAGRTCTACSTSDAASCGTGTTAAGCWYCYQNQSCANGTCGCGPATGWAYAVDTHAAPRLPSCAQLLLTESLMSIPPV